MNAEPRIWITRPPWWRPFARRRHDREVAAARKLSGVRVAPRCTCREGTPGVRCGTTGVWVSIDCPRHGR